MHTSFPTNEFTSKNQKHAGHLSRVGKSREINSYITDLLQNLTSHEGLYLGLRPS
jgi:hypothetical protein